MSLHSSVLTTITKPRTPMAKPRQTAAVIQEIMTRIENGSLMPGDQLDEKDLIEACSVSRTPVREALIQLEADGLVVRHPRRGVSLFRPDTDQFLAILEVHANLEAHAAELAAERISPDQRELLISCTAECDAFADAPTPDGHQAYYELNRIYHATVADAAANPYLTEMIKLNARKLMAHYRLRYRMPGAISRSAQEHGEITKHIIARDGSGARKAMLDHFNYDRETVMHMIASVR